MFIEKINNTYNSIYDDTNNQNLSIKNDLLVKILLKGVLKPIKTLMVLNQLLLEVTTWEDAQKAASRCETTLYKQNLVVVGETGAKWNTGWSETVEFWYEKLV